MSEDRVSEWEFGLPEADDLTPLSQALISPELASAFSISLEPSRTLLELNRAFQNTLGSLRLNSDGFSSNNYFKSFAENQDPMVMEQEDRDRSESIKSRKVDTSEEADSAPRVDNSGDDPSNRTLKRPRLVWTPQLHKRFVDVVAHLGINKAVPKTIMHLMNVEGLTRENVASHLQKYRLYLKRMHGLSNEGPSSSDHLFASTPVPQSLQEHGGGHGNRQIPVPIQMPYGTPSMIPMPFYGMPHASIGMQMAKSEGSGKAFHEFESNPYMLQQRNWSGNTYGSIVSYPQSYCS